MGVTSLFASSTRRPATYTLPRVAQTVFLSLPSTCHADRIHSLPSTCRAGRLLPAHLLAARPRARHAAADRHPAQLPVRDVRAVLPAYNGRTRGVRPMPGPFSVLLLLTLLLLLLLLCLSCASLDRVSQKATSANVSALISTYLRAGAAAGPAAAVRCAAMYRVPRRRGGPARAGARACVQYIRIVRPLLHRLTSRRDLGDISQGGDLELFSVDSTDESNVALFHPHATACAFLGCAATCTFFPTFPRLAPPPHPAPRLPHMKPSLCGSSLVDSSLRRPSPCIWQVALRDEGR